MPWSHGMNEVTDLLNDLNACGSDALEQLDAGDIRAARTSIKALLDAIRENLEGDEELD